EDAPAGIAAGLAAGAHVLAVTTTHETDELTRAHAVVPDLSACDFSSAAGRGIVVVTSTSSSWTRRRARSRDRACTPDEDAQGLGCSVRAVDPAHRQRTR